MLIDVPAYIMQFAQSFPHVVVLGALAGAALFATIASR